MENRASKAAEADHTPRSSTSAAHTPGPWRVGFSDGSGASEDGGYWITANDKCVVRSGDSFGLLYGIESEADVNFIVRACNSHYELVDALKHITSLVGGQLSDNSRAAFDIANTALAKAEGK
jgi:hypothetical protein